MSQTAGHGDPSTRASLSRGLGDLFRALTVLVLIIVGVPLVCLAAYLVYWSVVPPYSATMQIPELRTTLTLRFFYIWDEQTDHGRYLIIQTPRGHIKIAMTAFDWAHNSRTSVYLTPAREIAILGPMGDDRLVSLETLTTKNARGPSDDWTYLGAFDFETFQTPAAPVSRRLARVALHSRR